MIDACLQKQDLLQKGQCSKEFAHSRQSNQHIQKGTTASKKKNVQEQDVLVTKHVTKIPANASAFHCISEVLFWERPPMLPCGKTLTANMSVL